MTIEKWGWRIHHIGIPTKKAITGERYLPQLKFYVRCFESCPFGIEWMKFDNDSPIHELIKTVPQVAFEVDDLDFELTRHDFSVVTKPGTPGNGVRVAMIEHNGTPVELIEFHHKELKQPGIRPFLYFFFMN